MMGFFIRRYINPFGEVYVSFKKNDNTFLKFFICEHKYGHFPLISIFIKKYVIMNRFKISEEEKKMILEQHMSHGYKSNVVSEQNENYKINMAIQCFLNKKGIKDDSGQPLKLDGSIGSYPNSKSAQSIKKYQETIGIIPGDGMWGENTVRKMSDSDKNLYKECISEHGSIIDKGLRWLGLD